MENYILALPTKIRRNFSKLRISAHSLKIETGRHSKPKTPPDKRICDYCNSLEVENEHHFLLNCPMFNPERQVMFESLNTFLTLDIRDKENLFTMLMNYLEGDTEVCKHVCIFINSADSLRGEVPIPTKHSPAHTIQQEFFRLALIQDTG